MHVENNVNLTAHMPATPTSSTTAFISVPNLFRLGLCTPAQKAHDRSNDGFY